MSMNRSLIKRTLIDGQKVEQFEKWLGTVGQETAVQLWMKAKKGEIGYWDIWKTAFPGARVRRQVAEDAVKYGLERFIKKNSEVISRLLEEEGLGLERVIEKMKELLEAHRVDVYKGQVTIDPRTGGVLKHADNQAQLKAVSLLMDLHGLKKEAKGPQVMIYINAPRIEKPEDAGVGVGVKVRDAGQSK